MTIKELNAIALSSAVLWLAACAPPPPEENNNAAAANNASSAAVPFIEGALEAASAATEDTETARMVVEPEFNFETSDTVTLRLSLPEAAGHEAHVAICADFVAGGSVLDIDYDSCLVKAPLVNGEFEQPLRVTHETEQLVAAVWFQDASLSPLKREFLVSELPRQ